MAKRKKVVLAYSGGLDTSVLIKWLQERYDLDVIACVVDVGQEEDLKSIRDRALKVGAVRSEIIDAKRSFIDDYLMKALKANALYEGKYPLVSALSRPLIAKAVIDLAKASGASYVAHGCTGKGNDQVRFETSFRALDPSLKIIAPIREDEISREVAVDYAKRHKIPVPVTKKSPFSIDENIWGRAIEGGPVEDIWNEPPAHAYKLTRDVSKAPDKPAYIEIAFERGLPVSLNGKKLKPRELITQLNELGGKHGTGRLDMIENRLVGIKSREVYECPGSLILITAHKDLEDLTLERDLVHYKRTLEQKYAELVYYGLWFSPLKEAIDAFVDETQVRVSGVVRMKLYKGSASVVGRASNHALYDLALATYGEEDTFSHQAARGFVELWGLPVQEWARKGRK